MTTRGIRNNNPGNIRLGAGWQGMADEQTDHDFVVFKAPEWGIRAIAKILLSDARNGITNVRGIINRWAPPVENNTDAYIAAVSNQLQVNPDQYIDITVEMTGLDALRVTMGKEIQSIYDNLLGGLGCFLFHCHFLLFLIVKKYLYWVVRLR